MSVLLLLGQVDLSAQQDVGESPFITLPVFFFLITQGKEAYIFRTSWPHLDDPFHPPLLNSLICIPHSSRRKPPLPYWRKLSPAPPLLLCLANLEPLLE